MSATVVSSLPVKNLVPHRGSHHGKQRKVRMNEKHKERKKEQDLNFDIFADHWLIESPRRVLRQKTIIPEKTLLASHLESFYEEVVFISTSRIEKIKSRCQEIREYIFPRVKKFGNQNGMSLQKMIYTGSITDNTMVVKATEVDMFLIFDCNNAKVESGESGYYQVPLKRYKEDQEDIPDQFRFGRSENGRYLSSLKVSRNVYDLVQRALKMNNKLTLLPFALEEGIAPIRVQNKRLIVNIIPAFQPEKGNAYIHCRPYIFDSHLDSDEHWRVSFVEREKEICDMMDLADRGARTKAYKILKGLVKSEPGLRGLSSYHLKTILLHNFDSDVDNTPRWQREQLELCFRGLLLQLERHLSSGSLSHFFIRGFDLFRYFPPRLLSSLRGRVGYMISHESDVLRMLKKR